MAQIFRISDAASLALHAMAMLAACQHNKLTVHEIASELDVSENHLSKVCQRLVKAGLVKSERGPKGGLDVAKDPREINFLQVYEAIEGPLVDSHCLLGRDACDPSDCILGGLMESINNEVREHFSQTTLDKFVKIKQMTNGTALQRKDQ